MKREQLLKRLSALQFAMWESRMYLDTHPCDEEVQKMFDNYEKKYKAVRKEYEAEYGPLTVNSMNSDEWLKDPWPWDNN